MKYCKKCGHQLIDSAMFCSECGEKCEDTDTSAFTNDVDMNNTIPPSMNFDNQEAIAVGKPRMSKKKKIILISSISLLLVVLIVVGAITVPMLMSGGAPKIISIDKDTAVFDMSFEEFKKGYNNSIEPVFNALSIYSSIDLDEYKVEFNNDDNWYSWEENDTVCHNWTYQYNDSFSYDIVVNVDKDTQKVKSISSQSYSQELITKLILSSYLLYGENGITENSEILYNFIFFLHELEFSTYDYTALKIDNLLIYPYVINDRSNPTYYFLGATEEILEDFSDEVLVLSREDLPKLDKALSARYGLEYEWQTMPD